MTEILKYKNADKVIQVTAKSGVTFLQYPLLAETGIVKHGFSTRLGGVSEGIYESMNLSFKLGDEEAAVRENFERMARALEVETSDMVFAMQTHTANVRKVTNEDRGKGIVSPLDYQDVDGLITNEPGICLVTTYADCVPLFFVDPVHQAIGLSHSGWRGTVGRIGQVTLGKMHEEYGTEVKDVFAAIGPSICQDCYEVSADVIEQFKNTFAEHKWEEIFYQKDNGKYQLNLWKSNEIILDEAGVLREHMAVTNVCTNCNSEVLFSHRATAGKRGSLAAFMALK